MAQKKVNWPLAYAITGAIDALQLIGALIPFVDFVVIPANEILDVAIGAGIAWWGKKIGALDLGSGAAIGVTFVIEEFTGATAPFWVGDIGILHLKYKASQALNASAVVSTALNQGNRREPTGGPIPQFSGGRSRPKLR
ncbi:MAG: hypothetical protein WCQ60_02295 [bacterium]